MSRPVVAALTVLMLLGAGLPCGAQPLPNRSSDDLLLRADLQSVVDAQVRRDGAALTEALADADSSVRARAAFALASVQDTAAVSALVQRLQNDAAPTVRTDAAFALGQMPDAVPSEPLFGAARDGHPALQRRAIEALGKTGDAASLRRLAEADLPDRLGADVALAIARYGLRGIHDSLAVNRLVQMLSEGAARLHAAYYFGRMSDTAPWSHRADAVRQALSAATPDDPAAMHLVRGVGRLGAAGDVAQVQDVLRTARDERVRVNAVRALAGATDQPAVVAALTEALDDASPHVNAIAAGVLSGTEVSPSQAEALIEWVKTHPDRWRVAGPLLQCIAQSAAPETSTPFVRQTVRRWASADRPVTYAAVLPALALLDTGDADPTLFAAGSHDDPRVAYAALTALAKRWSRLTDDASSVSPEHVERYFNAFAAGVHRGDIATVNAAAPALSDSLFAASGATGILVRTYRRMHTPDDVEAMTALLRALGTAPDSSQAAPVLRKAVRHEHLVIRSAAASALRELTGSAPALPEGTAEAPAIDWTFLQPLGPAPRLVLDTDRGRIVVELDAEQAPQTVATIAQFARDGRYDGVPFHRVVPNFVVQGGDFERGDGWGGPGFAIRSECTRIPYARGTIGMASAGKDTEGSQFFLTHSMQPHLDGRYTAFGRVVEGMEVVDRILPNDTLRSASIQPAEGR